MSVGYTVDGLCALSEVNRECGWLQEVYQASTKPSTLACKPHGRGLHTFPTETTSRASVLILRHQH